MAPLSMLTLFACSPNQYQQTSEYDDVYFTSADRQQAPKVVTKPFNGAENFSQAITLENSSRKTVDQDLVNKYTNSTPSEVEYFVAGEVGPKVEKPNQLNYRDFVSDYENELLANYALPLDWETEWDANYFDDLVRNDFEFRLAWYDQYYVGRTDRMDRYLEANSGRVGNAVFSDFNNSRMMANGFFVDPFRPRIGISAGIGFGFGGWNSFGVGFGNNFYDPFFNNVYDPFFFNGSWGWNGFNRWNRGNRWNRWNGGNRWGGGFYDPYVYCPPVFSNQYIYRGNVIVAQNNRTLTRGGRLQSSSVSSVRSDATNGVAPTRSQRLSSTSGNARSNLSRSAIASRSSRNSGRVTSTSASGVSSTRSSRSSSTNSTVASTRSSRATRTSTDAYRFDDSSRSRNSRSSNVRANATSGRSVVSSRTSRSSSSRTSTSRSVTSRSSSSNSSRPSFSRSSSSRSTSGSVSRSSGSSRSSSSASRSSGSRSSSSRSSGVRSSSSSSSRSSGSVSRSSGSSSSRSSGSSSKSSSSSSRSGGSRSSGRGN
mgnify:CR=1 FL=1